MGSDLHVWVDDVPRDGPLNMAVDEALLEWAESSWLRVYRWDGPWVSIGWFSPHFDAEAAFPGRPGVRRWTGGGIVDHANDWTYSLVVPRHHPLGALNPTSSYRFIHQALARALGHHGRPADLAAPPTTGRDRICFQSPVTADVMHAGRKIAGAAQRRTRHGLLHQGSVQGIDIPEGMALSFAHTLAANHPARPSTPSPVVLARATTIAREKYGSPQWWPRR